MKIKELELTNFQSYVHGEVTFPDGTTFIRGKIGTGKSTLLRGIFGALFQTDASNEALGIDSLDELVKLGEDNAAVKLVFEVQGVEYTVEWSLDIEESEDGDRSATTDDCILSSPELDEPVSGYNAVKGVITEELIKMDSEAFVNSVYVQQHDIRRLLSADTSERQEILDGLLGLDKLDTYIERIENARASAFSIKRDAKAEQNTIRDQLEELDGESELEEQKRDITQEISEKEDKVEEAKAKKSEWEEAVRDVKEEIESFEDRNKRLDELKQELSEQENEVESLTDNIQNWQTQQEEHSQEIARLQDEISKIDDALEEYIVSSESDAEAAEESLVTEESEANAALATANTELSQAKSAKDELETSLEEVKDELAEAEKDVDTLEKEIQDVESKLDDAHKAVSEAKRTRNDRTAALLQDEVSADEVTQLHESVVEARVNELDEDREEIGNEISAKSSTLNSLDSQLDNVGDEIEKVETAKDETEEEISRLRSEELPAAESDVQEIEARLDDTVSDLDAVGETFDINVSVDALETIRDAEIPEVRSSLTADRDEVVEQISSYDAEVARLEDQLEHIEHLEDGEDCPLCGQGVPEDLSHEERRKDVESAIQTVKEELEEARNRKEKLDRQAERLDTFASDIRNAIQLRENQLAEAKETVESIEDTLSELDDSASNLEEEHNSLLSEAEDIRSEKTQLQSKIDELQSRQTELVSKVEDGNEVLETFSIVEDQEREAEKAESRVEQLIEKRDLAVKSVSDLEDEIERVEEELVTQGETIEEKIKTVADSKNVLKEIRNTKDQVESALERYDEIDELERAIESLSQEINTARDKREDATAQLTELDSEIEELRSGLDDTDIESLRSDKEKMEANIEELDTAIETFESEIRELDRRQSTIETRLQQIEELQDRISTAEEREAWASDLYEEFESIHGAYERVKSRLREKNIALLEQYVNDLFNALYQQQSFERVELGAGYEMSMIRADGERMTPRLTSGGEGAILNLALRAAIYRLIAEKEARAGELPPLILDEPTEGLDNTHIREVTELIEEIRKWDVPQVFVVTHQEELFESGFNEIVVEMDNEAQSSRTEVRTGSVQAASVGGDD